MEKTFKAKTLLDKDTKEFLVINEYLGKPQVFTTSTPNMLAETATMELLKECYQYSDIIFDTMEIVDVEIKII